jgi:hypothetical protein
MSKKVADWSWLWALPEERPHHPYSPSSLQNLEACPCYKNRNSTNERAVAGTLAHKVVETQEDDLRISDKDFLAAAECLDFVEERRAAIQRELDNAIGCNEKVQEEKEIYLPIDDCRFADCDSTTAGYVDHLLLAEPLYYAELIDWKFGMWQVEGAENNLQGIAYTLGVFKRFPKIQTVRFWFKQPHIEFLTEHTFQRADIPALYLRVQTVVAKARVARAAGDFKTARPYVPVCNFCQEVGRCPRMLDFALRIAKKFHPVEFPESLTLGQLQDPENTTKFLNLCSIMKVFSEGGRRQVTEQVLRGSIPVPEGMRLQEMPGRREIVDLDKFEKAAKAVVPEDIYKSSLSATFGPIEAYLSEHAPRGQKKATVEEFQNSLEASGAVTRGQPYTFLKVSNKKKDE